MSEDVTIDLPDTTNALGLKGSVPEGSITIATDGKIAMAVKNNRYCVTKGFDDKDVTVTENYEKCKNPALPITLSEIATTSEEVTSVPACLTDGTKCATGTPVAIKVNDDKIYNFYVISETNNEVTLIMDRNIGNKVAWTSKSDYITAGGNETDYGINGNNNLGPITVLNYLNLQINSETETWTNIAPIESYEYKNNPDVTGKTYEYGYQKLEITNGIGVLTSQDGTIKTTLTGTMRARILTYEEANTLNTNNGGKTPTWLVENLSSSNTTAAPYGYWFLTANPSNSHSGRSLDYTPYIGSCSVFYEAAYGARPVIEISKSL